MAKKKKNKNNNNNRLPAGSTTPNPEAKDINKPAPEPAAVGDEDAATPIQVCEYPSVSISKLRT
jgi:hypothetical protein